MWKSLVVVVVASVLLFSGEAQAWIDVTGPGDVVVGVPNDGISTDSSTNGWPPNELPRFAIDNQILTKYLHFKGEAEPTGIRVTPAVGATVVKGLSLTTANDAVERDPVRYELSGSNVSIDGPYTLIHAGSIVDFAGGTAWPRRTKNTTPIQFENNVAYQHYQLMFPAVRTPGGANSMQIAEIELLMPVFKASTPAPADGAIHEDTWATLTWTPGFSAVSHDIYMSTNAADVQNGTPETFRGNQASAYFVVGFPGFAFPEGLQLGTTYYWRIDELNPGHPDSPWKGDVWSFTVPPKTAWNPDPPNGARFIDQDVDLSWRPGWGAKMHTVYFGDNLDTVTNAAGGAPQVTTTYALNTLSIGKTYYWRVDEFDGRETHKGGTWSFTTTSGKGGVLGEYFNNTTLSGTPVLRRIDPGVSFDWGATGPGAPLPDNGWSARWTADLNILFEDTYTFSVNSEGGTRLWIDEKPVIDMWVSWVATRYASLPIRLESGVHSLRLEFVDWDRNAVQQLYWSAPSVAEQIIPAGPLQPPFLARRPNPADDDVDTRQALILRWVAGYGAASHQVYFGTDENAVLNAGTSALEYKGAKNLGEQKYDPGKLAWNSIYYWRIDEVNTTNAGSPWKGDVWSFTTANFLVIDDFEAYTDNDGANEAIWQTWVDGFATPTVNGSQVGSLFPPYAEQNIIHKGRQSMPVLYNNATAQYSEVSLALGSMDLTENGGKTLRIWFRGDAANAADPLYVALNDNAVVAHTDPAAAQTGVWIAWNIDLQEFAKQGVDLTKVAKITVGLGSKKTPKAGGTGTMYFDDIGVH